MRQSQPRLQSVEPLLQVEALRLRERSKVTKNIIRIGEFEYDRHVIGTMKRFKRMLKTYVKLVDEFKEHNKPGAGMGPAARVWMCVRAIRDLEKILILQDEEIHDCAGGEGDINICSCGLRMARPTPENVEDLPGHLSWDEFERLSGSPLGELGEQSD